MDQIDSDGLKLGKEEEPVQGKLKRKLSGQGEKKYKKAPDAPKRFKSSFIIFSSQKHKEIRKRLKEEGKPEKTTEIAKLISEEWKNLSAEEREEWEAKADRDKERFEAEKSIYTGSWTIPANMRIRKDPRAPKRPMSAFLAYSNSRRAALKRENPGASNADLSKMLSKSWKEAPAELKEKYYKEERALREKYKVETAKWRKEAAEKKKAELEEREAKAFQAMAFRAADARNKKPDNGTDGRTEVTSAVSATIQPQPVAEAVKTPTLPTNNQYQYAAEATSLNNFSLPSEQGIPAGLNYSSNQRIGNPFLPGQQMWSPSNSAALTSAIYQQTLRSITSHLHGDMNPSNRLPLDLTSSNLASSNLTSSNLTNSNLTSSNLTSSNLTSSNLTSSNLTGSNLNSSNLNSSNLNSSNINSSNHLPLDLNNPSQLQLDLNNCSQLPLDLNPNQLPLDLNNPNQLPLDLNTTSQLPLDLNNPNQLPLDFNAPNQLPLDLNNPNQLPLDLNPRPLQRNARNQSSLEQNTPNQFSPSQLPLDLNVSDLGGILNGLQNVAGGLAHGGVDTMSDLSASRFMGCNGSKQLDK